jgi:hypothetical protein
MSFNPRQHATDSHTRVILPPGARLVALRIKELLARGRRQKRAVERELREQGSAPGGAQRDARENALRFLDDAKR